MRNWVPEGEVFLVIVVEDVPRLAIFENASLSRGCFGTPVVDDILVSCQRIDQLKRRQGPIPLNGGNGHDVISQSEELAEQTICSRAPFCCTRNAGK